MDTEKEEMALHDVVETSAVARAQSGDQAQCVEPGEWNYIPRPSMLCAGQISTLRWLSCLGPRGIFQLLFRKRSESLPRRITGDGRV